MILLIYLFLDIVLSQSCSSFKKWYMFAESLETIMGIFCMDSSLDENDVIVYSPSCCFKAVLISVLYSEKCIILPI